MKIETFVAIDPGYSGSIVINHGAIDIVSNDKLRSFPKIMAKMTEIKSHYPGIFVCIEISQMFKSDDRKFINTNKLVINYTEFINTMFALRIPFFRVHPRAWQKYLHLYDPSDTKEQGKDRRRDYAKQMFKDINVTRRNQDSLCILCYVMKLYKFDLNYLLTNSIGL